MRSLRYPCAVALSALALIGAVGCGKNNFQPQTTPQTYTIGGPISGLTGAGLVLQDNGSDNLSVSANASSFSFAIPIATGAAYSVTILTQPAGEVCAVSGGSGIVNGVVSGLSIACVPAYTIGGRVFGLTGTGLVVQDNSGNNLTITAGASNYAFTIDGQIPAAGAPYVITVLTNPSGQSCTVANPVGTATANVTNADITCSSLASTTYTIGGTVSGLAGAGLILQDNLNVNDSDLLPVSANGSFTFVDPATSGSGYNVTVYAQPAGRSCAVTNGTGTASANITNVIVACVGEWTWMGGSSTVGTTFGQPGVYGTLGTAAATNIPGGRGQSLTWTDASGARWLFGGYGQDSTATGGLLNDLWKFDPKQGEWIWINGSDTTPANPTTGAPNGTSGVYGTLGVADPTNMPGGREQSISWTDASGNIWLFGGEGIDANGDAGELNDLWKYDPTANEWTWMGGGTSVPPFAFSGPAGVYGTLGVADAANVPGGRYGAISWIDASGNLWLFGGNGIDSTGTLGFLNDLWKYTPNTDGTAGEWTWMGGSATLKSAYSGASGVYGVLGIPDSANIPGGRFSPSSWIDPSGNLWLSSGQGIDSAGNQGVLNDLWKYTPGTNGNAGSWTWESGGDNIGRSGGLSGVYGTLGVQGSASVPGSRFGAASWTDSTGNLWLFGGQGNDANGNQGYLNDLWEFQP